MVNLWNSISQWSRLWSFDLVVTLSLLSLCLVCSIAYAIRIFYKGKAHFARVDKQGASALLGKSAMEGTYWLLQPLGRALVSAGVTPNQISFFSLFLGIAAGACLAFGHFGSGAVFALFSALLDAVDGLVARMSGTASEAGEVFDASIDRYVEFFFLAGLVVYYRDMPALVALSLFALLGSFMVSYSTAKAEALHVDPPRGSMRRPERAVYLVAGAALSPITITWFETLRDTPVPVGHPMVLALALVAVLSNVSAVERLTAIYDAVQNRDRLKKRLAEQHELASAAGLEDEHGSSDHSHSHIRR